MAEIVTLELPETLAQQARAIAALTHRRLEDTYYSYLKRRQYSNDESNLWLACPLCNGYKSDKTTAVDPETGETVK